MSETEQRETKTVTGVCSEISERGDWTTFHIDVGSQYPVKLSTKLAPLVELGRAASKDGNRFVWSFSESQGGENPHKPGTFYTNRYMSGVEPADSVATPAAAPKAESSEGMTPEKWDAKERRDYRSRAWAQTLAAFQHTIKVDEKPEDVFLRLQPFQRKVFSDVCGMFAYPEGDEGIPF